MVGLRLRFWLGEVVLMDEVSAVLKAVECPFLLGLRGSLSKPLTGMASTEALVEIHTT